MNKTSLTAPPRAPVPAVAPSPAPAPLAPTPGAVLVGGRIKAVSTAARTTKRRKKRSHPTTFFISEHKQKLLLKLPHLADHMIAQRREDLVLIVERLAGRVSQTEIGRALNLSPSRLSEWRKLYREGGRTALMPKPIGPRAKGHPASSNLCELILPR